ncbi:MAG: hypothetical protein Q8M16_00870 [Pirellulaceae bacterium]|nr:hypothetical protein [Pirellulaceae bacterium]
MIDATTKARLAVSTDGEGGPYIMVPLKQIDEVRELLDANSISYWVDDNAISLDGKPEVTVVNLGHGSEATRVQKILDKAS